MKEKIIIGITVILLLSWMMFFSWVSAFWLYENVYIITTVVDYIDTLSQGFAESIIGLPIAIMMTVIPWGVWIFLPLFIGVLFGDGKIHYKKRKPSRRI